MLILIHVINNIQMLGRQLKELIHIIYILIVIMQINQMNFIFYK